MGFARPAIAPTDAAGRSCLSRWRRLVRDRWRPYLAYCGVILVIDVFRLWSVVAEAGVPTEYAVEHVRWLQPLIMVLSMALPVFAALVASEALGLRGVRHAIATLVALALCIVTGLASLVWWHHGMLNRLAVDERLIVSDSAFIAREAWLYFASGALLAVYFASRARAEAFTRLAQAAELDRVHAERATLASRLKVMQARVEPELLFGVLSDVRRFYEREPAIADALLDDLIGYLRATLPQLRGEASTLGREVALAAAYLRLSPPGRFGRLAVDVSIGTGTEHLAFPPMVLLPLAHRIAAHDVARVMFVLVRAADALPSGVALRVDSRDGPMRWSTETLGSLDATLAQYFGPSAGLAVDAAGAVVRWAGADVTRAAA